MAMQHLEFLWIEDTRNNANNNRSHSTQKLGSVEGEQ